MKDILISYKKSLNEQKINFLHALAESLDRRRYNIIYSDDIEDSVSTIKHNARIVTFIFDWEHFELKDIEEIAEVNPDLPVFAIDSDYSETDLELSNFCLNLEFLQYDQHLIYEDADRIELAIKNYIDKILPPFTKELMTYVDEKKYTFCTPGHMGGTAFTLSPVGAIFHDFFGENTFKADISISVPELGSLLDHSGLHKKAEEFISDTFNSDYSYIVTNGTSTANKMVGMYSAAAGDTVLIDRNCHKSLCHFMLMSNVNPIYLKPTRNAYGILGGIPQKEFSKESIEAKIAESPIAKTWPSYAVITNSTYDGLLYNTSYIKNNLHTRNLHFDSAWTPHANLHPIYQGKYGMYDTISHNKEQIIFETHSTHKLLAAFSQASMIHIKGDIDKDVMNECYMMHTSTSPLYQITASCEIAAAMVKGKRGYNLVNSSIKRALNFRKEIKKLRQESINSWYYDVWQPEQVDNMECWELKNNDSWHGFKNQDNQHIYLDPIKVTLIMPGITDDKLDDFGIPAAIVAMYLDKYGVIVEKTGPYSILFLFSIGINRPKTMKLLTILNNFKRAFDSNQMVKDMLPDLHSQHPEFYETMTIQELASKIHNLMKEYDLPNMMYNAFEYLPQVIMNPHSAFQYLIKGKTKLVKLRDMLNKISAVMVLPYPPGVPLIMPGEKITEDSKAVLNYLIMLEEIGRQIPGFATDIHGVEQNETGELMIKIIEE